MSWPTLGVWKRLGLLVAALALAGPAYPWGVEGHRTVADLAREQLSPSARAAVIRILGNDDLAAVAVWADELRLVGRHQGPLADDAEAHAFNAKFPHNYSWHYVDLPLGMAYADDSAFASPDDVVHAIRRTVAVLEGRSGEMTPIVALRLLVHFVGDLHQPLHAANGYFDLSDPAAPRLMTDPARIDQATGDRGGNSLFFTRTAELHAYWDSTLVARLAQGADDRALAARLAPLRPAGWQTPGDFHTWAAAWASESSRMAAGAYAGIVFGPATVGPKGQLERMQIRLPAGYEERSVPTVADQLAKAGLRLAALLNAIFRDPRPAAP
jgi:hypothetical protein